MSSPDPGSLRAELEIELGDFRLDVAIAASGRPLALVGPNGAGKSTVLRALAGALRPTRGYIAVGDSVILDTARGVDLPMERRGVGYLPQGAGLFPHLSALDNVAFGIPQRPGGRASRRHAAEELLAEMGVAAVAPRRPAALSGGERQRVALARALAVNPGLLLLDEPLAGVDVAARRRLRAFMARQLEEHPIARVVVTHNARDLHAFGADVCVLEAGRVVQVGSVEELERAPVNDFVAELLA